MIYLAADYSRQWEMRQKRIEIESRGITVRSRWLDAPNSAAGVGGVEIDESNLGEYELCAFRDLADLEECDEFILFTTGELSRGGRHWETGFAVAQKMVIHLIGPREHTFHCIPPPLVQHYPTWELFLYMLDERQTVPFRMSSR